MIASKYLRMYRAQRIHGKCAKYYSSVPVPKHQQVWKKYAFRTAIGLLVSGIAYDGTNEFEYCGGAGRFLRSLKIAAFISFDYAWNLYGVDEASEEYSKVSIGFCLFIYIALVLCHIRTNGARTHTHAVTGACARAAMLFGLRYSGYA